MLRISGLFLACALCVSMAQQQYVVTTVAGGGAPPVTSIAADNLVGLVTAVATDPAGAVYIGAENCVFKIDSSGTMTRIAGTGRAGFSGDGGAAVNAQLGQVYGLAFDGKGSLLIADSGASVIRRVTGGVISTVPGSAIAAIGLPIRAAIGPSGDIFISDPHANLVWKISPAGALSIFAGNSDFGYSGDGGPAKQASVGSPLGVTVDASGNVFIAQWAAVRKVSPSGVITTVAGTGTVGESGDGGPAMQAQLFYATSVAVDSSGALYIAEAQRIRKVSTTGTITTVAGGGSASGPLGDGGPATSATLLGPAGVAVTASGDLYIADNRRVRHVSAAGVIETIEGGGASFTGDGGSAISAQLYAPSGIALDAAGGIYVADNGSRIRKFTSGGNIATIAGGPVDGYSGDGGAATAARMQLLALTGMAVDSASNLYVVEQLTSCVRKISPQGAIATVVGPGTGYGGDGGQATKAQMHFPNGLAIDGNGNLFIADSLNGLIRKVDTTGKITAFAGSIFRPAGYPYAIAVDGVSRVYASDSFDSGVAQYSPTGAVTHIAPAIAGMLPMTVDSAGNIYGFSPGSLIRIAPDGSSTVIANFASGFPVDGSSALDGAFDTPAGIAVDASGNIYIVDSALNAVFKLSPSSAAAPPSVNVVMNSATNFPGPVAPGEIVTLFGSGLGPSTLVTAQLDADGFVSRTLAGVQVFFSGIPAPLIYTSATQTAVVVPYGVSQGSTVMTVSYSGKVSAPVSLPVSTTTPGLFTANSGGYGQAAALNQDGSFNSASQPAAAGSIITLFATGEGQTSPAGADGKLAVAPLPSPLLPVTLTIGGLPATIVYAGAAPGEVAGLMQINATIPVGTKSGNAAPVVLQMGDVLSGTATVAIK